MKRLLASLIAVLFSSSVFAQTETETLFRQSGKIYVVVAIVSLIFLGIIIYLIMMDRRISKLEKEKRNA